MLPIPHVKGEHLTISERMTPIPSPLAEAVLNSAQGLALGYGHTQ